jgi:hypothetical protein
MAGFEWRKIKDNEKADAFTTRSRYLASAISQSLPGY